MLVFDAISPAPRCLRMFILEKNVSLDSVVIDVFAGENRQAPYLAINPAGQTPALQLDNGVCLAEAVTIAEYLEELYPHPVLIGHDAEQRAQTRMWWRRVELNISEFIHNAFHYAEGVERFRGRIPIAEQAADGLKQVAQDRIIWLNSLMTGPYLCGKRFSAADIWLYVWLDFANQVNQTVDFSALDKLAPWFERVSQRPSAERSKTLLSA